MTLIIYDTNSILGNVVLFTFLSYFLRSRCICCVFVVTNHVFVPLDC